VIFGGLVAASLPLVIGGVAILGAFTMLRVLSLVTDVSIFAVNIVTFLGLGLAIDYALFIVSRFREELRRDGQVEGALVRTMQTAGRTVAFSGITVAVSLASLLFFPQNFLRSMGFGGMAAVLVAMVGALTVLPALLAVLGRRVDSVRIPMPFRRRRATAAADRDADHGAWSRVAHSVMRRPVVYVGATVVLLLALGAPFLRIAFGGVDARVLPEGTPSRTVSESLQRDFTGASTSPIEVVVTGADPAALGSYVESLRAVPGVAGADVTGQAGETTRISLRYAGEATADATQDLVTAVRDVPVPSGADVLVGGETAALVDLLGSLGATLPWMALFVVAVTGVLLFLAFGSVVLPVKAVVMNILSLAATFGAVVWIFQDGNLSGLLGFTSTGTIEATQPILILALAFGLSMDYEVFLLSRIREQWDRTGDNAQAVATGLQRSGKIITSAALLLVVVIGAFSTSGITFLKMIGVGMVVAIVIDATIVRALLVPATMRLLGNANWYAPKPLLRLYDRIGFKETDEIELPGPRSADTAPEPART
jgi:RND superfamily putative drug exporter